MTRVKHDQIEQGTDGKSSPDSKVVIHLHLSNWHPLEVGSHSVHFALIDRNSLSTKLNIVLSKTTLGVVLISLSIAVGIIGNFVVIPDIVSDRNHQTMHGPGGIRTRLGSRRRRQRTR